MPRVIAPEFDVIATSHGSIVAVCPVTPAAKEWVEEHVALESWQWMGNMFAVEPRYLEDLLMGMEQDGLTCGRTL